MDNKLQDNVVLIMETLVKYLTALYESNLNSAFFANVTLLDLSKECNQDFLATIMIINTAKEHYTAVSSEFDNQNKVKNT